MFYDIENLIDEKKFYYEYFIKKLEKFCKILTKDFEKFKCIFLSEKELNEIFYKMEDYYEKTARISKILYIA